MELTGNLQIVCPIRGQLKVNKRSKDGLTATEEFYRVEAIKFLISKGYPKENFWIEPIIKKFGNSGRNSFRSDFAVLDVPASTINTNEPDDILGHAVIICEVKRDNKKNEYVKNTQVKPMLDFAKKQSTLGLYWDNIEKRVFWIEVTDGIKEIKEGPLTFVPKFGLPIKTTPLTFNTIEPVDSLTETFERIEDILHQASFAPEKRYEIILQLLLTKIFDEHAFEVRGDEPLEIQDYTVMRYLQYSTLQQKNLTHFDSWASTFGETTTAIELAPEGTGYRARTRFAKFFNLPELMNMFKEVADIKTSDQLHLPVPEAKFETVVVQPSEYQKDMVASLSERAADVHAGIVDPSVDNMLKITSDGRKLGLDQRLMNPLLPDDPDSKLNACVGNILHIWQDGQADKLTQLVFCDLSTPKNDGTFNVYDDVKTKLIANGVPAEEVAFIHDADTEAKKKDLFAKVRTGQVRVLLGSTQKMGAGTNVQDKLVAVHHLDVGWRPSDMTQRNGRIIRQGNRNKEVQVYQYVTEGTFDAYLYQTLENKQKFISQIMTSKSPVRSCDDVDEQALSYAEIKALCAGNPLIKEKMDLDIDVARLKVLKADHQSQQYRMEDKLLKYFPAEIEKQTGYIHGFEADMKTVEAHPQIADGFCGMEIMGKAYTEKADAGEILLAACKDTKSADPVPLGSYRGFQMELSFDSFRNEFDVTLKGAVSHRVALGTDARGNITRLDNALAGIPERLERANEQLNNLYNQQEAAKAEVGKPFPQEAELTAKSQRLAELDAALNMEDSAENRDERSESERPSVLADLKSKAEHIPPAKYSEPREEVL